MAANVYIAGRIFLAASRRLFRWGFTLPAGILRSLSEKSFVAIGLRPDVLDD